MIYLFQFLSQKNVKIIKFSTLKSKSHHHVMVSFLTAIAKFIFILNPPIIMQISLNIIIFPIQPNITLNSSPQNDLIRRNIQCTAQKC